MALSEIVLPAVIREQDHLRPGQEFDVKRVGEGKYILQRTSRPPNEGLIDLLLSCPVKGWFAPLRRRETTDDIVLPEFE